MIRANELRIGNWVKKEIWYKKTIEFYQIKPSHFANNKISSFNPIPITEEWLLKFGFTKINDSRRDGLYLNVNSCMISGLVGLEDDGSIKLWMHSLGTSIVNNIKYVHQLQNLYFALTQIELEINE